MVYINNQLSYRSEFALFYGSSQTDGALRAYDGKLIIP